MARVKTEVVSPPHIGDCVEIKTYVESNEPGFLRIDRGSILIPKKKIGTLIKQLKAWK